MSKMIKLSDQVGGELEKRAQEDGLSMAGEVAKLLATASLSPSPVDTSYFDKKFDELKTLIEDTTVDRLAGGGGGGKSSSTTFSRPTYLKWEDARPLLYEVMEEKDYASLHASEVCHEANDPLDIYIQDGSLYSTGYYGNDILIATISPKIRDYLSSKGYDIM